MRCILGFDGGGTKTECVLMDSMDHILARTYAGPSNAFRIGIEPAVRALEEAANLGLRETNLKPGDIAAVGAGLAGTGAPVIKERMRAALKNSFPGSQVIVLTDLEAALAAAGEGPAIVLVAGTGSGALGRNGQNEIYRAGGYGPLSSDEGSAYDIGRRAIAAAMREREQNGIDSELGKQILEQLQADSWDALQKRAQTAPDEVFPRIFPSIAAAADAGDSVAREILTHAVRGLSSLVIDVANRLGLRELRFSLAKTGGLIGRSSFFDAQLDSSLRQAAPLAQIGGLRISPAEAAALAAKG
jgi:glucosamine kinase